LDDARRVVTALRASSWVVRAVLSRGKAVHPSSRSKAVAPTLSMAVERVKVQLRAGPRSWRQRRDGLWRTSDAVCDEHSREVSFEIAGHARQITGQRSSVRGEEALGSRSSASPKDARGFATSSSQRTIPRTADEQGLASQSVGLDDERNWRHQQSFPNARPHRTYFFVCASGEFG